MFSFGFIFCLVAHADPPVVRRLFGSSHLEARRLDADDFGLAGMSCDKVSHTWTGEAGWEYAGSLSWTVPAAKNGLKYVVKLNDGSDGSAFGGLGWCGSCEWVKSTVDDTAVVVDPADWTDGHTTFNHWVNFGWSAHDKDLQNDIDLYFCWTLTVAPTPAPSPSPTVPTYEMYWNETDLAGTLVGIAGFLAQGSWETGKWESCDEINHTGSPTAACTQKWNQELYQVVGNESPNACPLDPSMTMTGTTVDASKRLHCEPGGELENCCWWGRGSIQTTGVGNFGNLQTNIVEHSTQFTGIDLCQNPGAICEDNDAGNSLKFVAGIYFWVTEVETDACFAKTRAEYLKSYNVEDTVDGCHSFARGIGGKINMGDWNTEAHGEDCWIIERDNCDHHSEWTTEEKDECKSDLACQTTNGCTSDCENPDGRVERFVDLMSYVKIALDAYTGPDPDATVCTENAAVDTIFHAMDLESKAGFNADISTYDFTGFCEALKEFI